MSQSPPPLVLSLTLASGVHFSWWWHLKSDGFAQVRSSTFISRAHLLEEGLRAAPVLHLQRAVQHPVVLAQPRPRQQRPHGRRPRHAVQPLRMHACRALNLPIPHASTVRWCARHLRGHLRKEIYCQDRRASSSSASTVGRDASADAATSSNAR